MARFLLLLPLGATAIGIDELSQWLASATGLDYARDDALRVAQVEAPILTQCAVTLDDLKKLKDTLYSTTAMDMSRDYVKANTLDLAKQHVDPLELKQIFFSLYSRTGLDITPKQDAQLYSIQLAKSYAEAQQLQDLFQVLYSRTGFDMPKVDAQKMALDLAKRGCDPTAFLNSCRAQVLPSKSERITAAAESCVRANLNGEVKKYAKDGKAYTAKEFQDYYKDGWVKQWAEAPFEKRVDSRDGKEYTTSQFRMYDKSSWEQIWLAATPATQLRLAEDGKAYTIQEFVSYYQPENPEIWQSKWLAAPELPCLECRKQQVIV